MSSFVEIMNNGKLQDIVGLCGLVEVGSTLTISGNPLLCCDVVESIVSSTTVYSKVEIADCAGGDCVYFNYKQCVCTDVPNRCANDGVCISATQGSYVCECGEDFFGDECEICPNGEIGRPCEVFIPQPGTQRVCGCLCACVF